MNAFAAAEASGHSSNLQGDFQALFERQNLGEAGATTIPATFLRVTVTR